MRTVYKQMVIVEWKRHCNKRCATIIPIDRPILHNSNTSTSELTFFLLFIFLPLDQSSLNIRFPIFWSAVLLVNLCPFAVLRSFPMT